jgi:hypothetical protein
LHSEEEAHVREAQVKVEAHVE